MTMLDVCRALEAMLQRHPMHSALWYELEGLLQQASEQVDLEEEQAE